MVRVSVEQGVNASGELFDERPDWARLLEFLKETRARSTPSSSRTSHRAAGASRRPVRLDEQLAPLAARLRAAESLFLEPEAIMARMTFIDALKFTEWKHVAIVDRTE
jgi:hypothetical protein